MSNNSLFSGKISDKRKYILAFALLALVAVIGIGLSLNSQNNRAFIGLEDQVEENLDEEEKEVEGEKEEIDCNDVEIDSGGTYILCIGNELVFEALNFRLKVDNIENDEILVSVTGGEESKDQFSLDSPHRIFLPEGGAIEVLAEKYVDENKIAITLDYLTKELLICENEIWDGENPGIFEFCEGTELVINSRSKIITFEGKNNGEATIQITDYESFESEFVTVPEGQKKVVNFLDSSETALLVTNFETDSQFGTLGFEYVSCPNGPVNVLGNETYNICPNSTIVDEEIGLEFKFDRLEGRRVVFDLFSPRSGFGEEFGLRVGETMAISSKDLNVEDGSKLTLESVDSNGGIPVLKIEAVACEPEVETINDNEVVESFCLFKEDALDLGNADTEIFISQGNSSSLVIQLRDSSGTNRLNLDKNKMASYSNSFGDEVEFTYQGIDENGKFLLKYKIKTNPCLDNLDYDIDKVVDLSVCEEGKFSDNISNYEMVLNGFNRDGQALLKVNDNDYYLPRTRRVLIAPIDGQKESLIATYKSRNDNGVVNFEFEPVNCEENIQVIGEELRTLDLCPQSKILHGSGLSIVSRGSANLSNKAAILPITISTPRLAKDIETELASEPLAFAITNYLNDQGLLLKKENPTSKGIDRITMEGINCGVVRKQEDGVVSAELCLKKGISLDSSQEQVFFRPINLIGETLTAEVYVLEEEVKTVSLKINESQNIKNLDEEHEIKASYKGLKNGKVLVDVEVITAQVEEENECLNKETYQKSGLYRLCEEQEITFFSFDKRIKYLGRNSGGDFKFEIFNLEGGKIEEINVGGETYIYSPIDGDDRGILFGSPRLNDGIVTLQISEINCPEYQSGLNSDLKYTVCPNSTLESPSRLKLEMDSDAKIKSTYKTEVGGLGSYQEVVSYFVNGLAKAFSPTNKEDSTGTFYHYIEVDEFGLPRFRTGTVGCPDKVALKRDGNELCIGRSMIIPNEFTADSEVFLKDIVSISTVSVVVRSKGNENELLLKKNDKVDIDLPGDEQFFIEFQDLTPEGKAKIYVGKK